MNWPGPEQECAALAESGQHLEVGAFFLLAGLGNLWVTGGAQQIRPPLVPPLIPLDPAAAGQTPSSVAFGPPGGRPQFFDLPAVHSYCHCFGPPDLMSVGRPIGITTGARADGARRVDARHVKVDRKSTRLNS